MLEWGATDAIIVSTYLVCQAQDKYLDKRKTLHFTIADLAKDRFVVDEKAWCSRMDKHYSSRWEGLGFKNE